MGARRPEDIHHLFGTAFNQRDIETIMALYEPECESMPQPGQVARGRSAIRSSLQKFLALKGIMDMKSVFIILGSDLALLVVNGSSPVQDLMANPLTWLVRVSKSPVGNSTVNGSWLLIIHSEQIDCA